MKFRVSVVRTQEQIHAFEAEAENVEELRKKLEDFDFAKIDQEFDAGEIVSIYYDVRSIKKTN